MRREYHFKFTNEDNEYKKFENLVKKLGLKIDAKIHGSGKYYDYIVSLSKYELLYIGLSCRTGEYVDVTEYIKNRGKKHIFDEKILHTGTSTLPE
jgi:hypothetical protein